MEYDWSRFTTRIVINAGLRDLYHAWATRAGMEHWFLRLSLYRSSEGIERNPEEPVSPGDTYLWRWHGWPDDIEESGTILDCNGHNMFSFSFGEAGNCMVQLYEHPGGCLLELHQTDIPTDERGKHYWHLGCKTGWTFHLTNMKSIFEGGADLRNKDVEVKGVINA